MARLKPETLFERAQRSCVEIETNRSLFEEADEFTNPFRNTFQEGRQTHQMSSKLFDSTAMIAMINFVNTMVSKFTPPFMRWAEIKAGPAVQEDQKDVVNKGFQSVTDIIFTNLNASNFNTAAPEMYWELGKGTGALLCLEGDEFQPLHFISVPLSQLGFSEGKNGLIDFVVRKWKIKPRLIKETWKKAKISKNLLTLIKDKPDEEVDIKECFYYDYEEMIWHYEVLFDKEKDILFHGTSRTCPVVVVRWLKIPGFVTGIGPALMALPDIKTLNKMKEYMLRLAALNVFGVYTVTDGGVFNPNSIKIKPGAFIPVKKNGGSEGKTIEPLPVAGNFQTQEYMINGLQDQIRQVMLDNRLPPENGPVKSALEIAERVKSLTTDIGASFGRLMFEFVGPLFRRIVEVLMKKGLLNLPEGFDIDNFFVQIQVVSPIAQQQSFEDVQKFTQAFQIVQGVDPELAQLAFMFEDIPTYIAEQLGSPAKLMRSKEEIVQIKEIVMQRVQQRIEETMAGKEPT